MIQHYINFNFYVAIKNLKNDPSDCVSELLINYNVITAEDADGLSNFDFKIQKVNDSNSDAEPQIEDYDMSSNGHISDSNNNNQNNNEIDNNQPLKVKRNTKQI